jgi:hypothetical protein
VGQFEATRTRRHRSGGDVVGGSDCARRTLVVEGFCPEPFADELDPHLRDPEIDRLGHTHYESYSSRELFNQSVGEQIAVVQGRCPTVQLDCRPLQAPHLARLRLLMDDVEPDDRLGDIVARDASGSK